ncbi:Crp/Fnr family transcriptional regulator [Cryobacterium breve]|uniref:Crp/Fnr family transcriptional regulator n=1 Tax=Cryobacterium breve TaxID=1259258 RepID=A0ABY7ND84_9MICO|nr:Crp/Fnr family transcriptional regulator [Cryobacterium breve]WBM80245.1 Crp/Fnr family transcriptional regulator [Cryobacterium breve]
MSEKPNTVTQASVTRPTPHLPKPHLRALPLRAVPLRSTCGRPHPCPPAMQRRILEQICLFQGLSGDELASIGARMESLAWSAGGALFSAGEPAEHVYLLAAGQVKAFRTTVTGQRTSLDFFGPGDVLGGLTWAGGSGYTETALALVTTCALQIDAGAFREVMFAHPSVALGVLDVVSGRLARARSAEQEQASATVTKRVATGLLRLADTFGVPGDAPGTTLIQLPLSRADLAAMAGTSAESASRAMSRLRRSGLIDTGRRWTAVLDADGLLAAK